MLQQGDIVNVKFVVNENVNDSIHSMRNELNVIVFLGDCLYGLFLCSGGERVAG